MSLSPIIWKCHGSLDSTRSCIWISRPKGGYVWIANKGTNISLETFSHFWIDCFSFSLGYVIVSGKIYSFFFREKKLFMVHLEFKLRPLRDGQKKQRNPKKSSWLVNLPLTYPPPEIKRYGVGWPALKSGSLQVPLEMVKWVFPKKGVPPNHPFS